MLRNANDILNQLNSLLETCFYPAINFIYTQFDELFYWIEHRWYLIFIWYLLNSGFILYVVASSFFDWKDIITDGFVRGALLSHAKANRLAEAEERYQLRKSQNRAEAEERYEKRKNEAEERYQERKKIREQENLALTHLIGRDSYFSDDYLARAYFEANPNKLTFYYGGKKYINQGLLNRYADEKNKREKDLLFGDQVDYDPSVNYQQVFDDSNFDDD